MAAMAPVTVIRTANNCLVGWIAQAAETKCSASLCNKIKTSNCKAYRKSILQGQFALSGSFNAFGIGS